MKAIVRRLPRLEDQFGSPGETDYDLWLRQRLESAKRRIAEARKRGELPPAEEGRPLTEFDQWRLEILKQAAWHAKLRADRRAKM
jgi:hypothetical protein